ncbi:MAG: substrate-binding domain-containing protein [Sulfuriferula sp.]
MFHFRAIAIFLAGFIFTQVAVGSQNTPADSKIRIGGTGSAIATMQILAKAFIKSHPGVIVDIVPSLGSSGGIKAMRAGIIDLAISSRALKPAERTQGVLATEYARTPFVFVVSTHNNASAITTKELVNIYKGETRVWPDGKTLRLILRPEVESDTDIIKNISPEMNLAVKSALARQGMIMAITDQDSADNIENIPGAIGTLTLAQVVSERRALKPLALNGLTPSLDALEEGAYPYFKSMYMVSSAKSNPLTQAFIAFVYSPAGRKILKENGQRAMPGK